MYVHSDHLVSSECTLRSATPADTEAILVVYVAAIIANGPAAYSDKQVSAWAAKAEGTDRYEDGIADPETELVVAEADSRVVGFGELDIESGEVKAVFVDPEWDGRGVGSSILRHFEHRLADEGLDVVRLRAVLNAVGVYRHHGYERDERVTNTTTNGVEVESVWMEKPL